MSCFYRLLFLSKSKNFWSLPVRAWPDFDGKKFQDWVQKDGLDRLQPAPNPRRRPHPGPLRHRRGIHAGHYTLINYRSFWEILFLFDKFLLEKFSENCKDFIFVLIFGKAKILTFGKDLPFTFWYFVKGAKLSKFRQSWGNYNYKVAVYFLLRHVISLLLYNPWII